MPRVTGTIKTKIIEFLDEHRDELKYARKGYLSRLIQQLKDEKDIDINLPQLKRILDYYRLTHDCPLQYVEGTHYKPLAAPKRNYQINN